MMGFLSIFLIALSLAADAFCVSVSNGMLLGRVSFREALKFGLFFGGFQLLMPLLGYLLGHGLGGYLALLGSWLPLVLLSVIGGKMIAESFRKDESRSVRAARNVAGTKNLTILAIATSVDALAVGVAFSAMDVNIWPAAAAIGAVAFALSAAGALAGARLRLLPPKLAERFAGFVLIAIGLKTFLGL